MTDPCIYCGTPTDGLICSDKCQREHFGLAVSVMTAHDEGADITDGATDDEK